MATLQGYLVVTFRIRFQATICRAWDLIQHPPLIPESNHTIHLTSRFYSCDPDLSNGYLAVIGERFTNGPIAKCLVNLIISEGDEKPGLEYEPIRKRTKRKKQAKRKPKPGTQQAQRLEEWTHLNTIVCPMREFGFQETFLREKWWYAIRVHPERIPYIKYIAAYRVSHESAITHYAEVESIKPFRSTGKYIVKLKRKAKKVGPVPLSTRRNAKVKAPQGPRFANIKTLLSAKTLDDCFDEE